ncbi:MAG TPA: ChaN family lipoprotein [Leptolyngbyaceae cyanobacterium M33_DOE_097]|uniref:Iron-regulated protein n=1 Tax=Oscillatoriales cyanobacterium SpSt-418 TaxID=2282169 RepID=A0A7C3PR69_9CYAN|nr:ChaN family lipoprotein [Leptolyngbyaceae cyanobacterium M33_DOE_097]
MTHFTKSRIWIGLLSLLLCVAQPLHAEPLTPTAFAVSQKTAIATAQLLDKLAQLDVVYLGETHDRAADHQAQLEILQMLHQKQPRLIIAMEMFQRPYQAVLDRYLKGELSEAELVEQSQYKTRWGFDWEFYAPILRFAKAQQLPVIALNTPSEVTRKVARQGLESLTPTERRFIPPLSAIAIGPDAYRQRLQDVFEAIHQGKTNSMNFDYFFQAQVLWDETMAERIAQVQQQNPDALVVVLVGQGHLFFGDGIPQRVTRRRPMVKQATVLLNPAEEVQTELQPPIADYFWSTVPEAGSK